jgi:hypothetical protein
MLEALVLVCAVGVNQEVIKESCFLIKDPSFYYTIESCDTKTAQMVNEVLNGDLTYIIFESYRKLGLKTELLYVESKCIAPGEQI